MRRTLIVVGMAVTAIAGAAGYLRSANWKEFHYPGTRLMADLGRPDALIRTVSLSKLPRDLLKVPIAKDVLTEDLVFYYEQNEDRLGLNGAIRRIAYEHKLAWSDRLLVSVFDEPAEVALWRDGKGALRHFAMVMRRNTLAKLMQELAEVALKDSQLKVAGEIETDGGKIKVYALELHPRRTLLLAAKGERLAVLSDPGLLFDKDNKVVPAAQAALSQWLQSDGALARSFELDGNARAAAKDGHKPRHTMAIGAAALSLGYAELMPGFKGVRFDFGEHWSTSAWIDRTVAQRSVFGSRVLWQAAPANPSGCIALPIDWPMAQQLIGNAPGKLQLSQADAPALLEGPVLACWYRDFSLYSPVFIARLNKSASNRHATVQALASWALAGEGQPVASPAISDKSARNKNQSHQKRRQGDVMLWRSAIAQGKEASADNRRSRKQAFSEPTVAACGQYLVFSPDAALVNLVLDTLARANPSVADQIPASDATLALFTPRSLAAMFEREALTALAGPGDAGLQAVVKNQLPAHTRALAAYPPYRLELTSDGRQRTGWQAVEWRTQEQSK